MFTYVCDRCGKNFQECDCRIKLGDPLYKTLSLELCPACKKELKKWMKMDSTKGSDDECQTA